MCQVDRIRTHTISHFILLNMSLFTSVASVLLIVFYIRWTGLEPVLAYTQSKCLAFRLPPVSLLIEDFPLTNLLLYHQK
jgi:hypothetical protein